MKIAGRLKGDVSESSLGARLRAAVATGLRKLYLAFIDVTRAVRGDARPPNWSSKTRYSPKEREFAVCAQRLQCLSKGLRPMPLNKDILSRAATEARGLAMDAVQAASSGHLGLPLGDAEIGAVLFGYALNYLPSEPRWLNRDRFVLSAGHGSMFLYGWLHLAGYDISRDDIRNFRQLHSKTPGHPEFRETPGVECTTGPLGQGVGNAVGLAVSAKMAAARFNTAEHTIFDQHIVCLAGDGCMQEGVASEAAAFAGFQKLDNLILIYDSNKVTLDAMANKSQSEDTAKRFDAYGFEVHTIDGHNMDEFLAVFEKAKNSDSG